MTMPTESLAGMSLVRTALSIVSAGNAARAAAAAKRGLAQRRRSSRKESQRATTASSPAIRSALAHNSSNQRNSSTTKDPNRHVSFTPKVRVRRVMSHRQYTPEEIAASWYSSEEMRTTTMSTCKEVAMLERGVELKGRKYCHRGLESHTRRGRSTKFKARKDSIQAVLDEQAIQWDADVSDVAGEEAIAQAYIRRTSASQLWATNVGFRDQRDAQASYDEEVMDSIHTSMHAARQVDAMSLNGDSNNDPEFFDEDESQDEDDQDSQPTTDNTATPLLTARAA